MGGAPGDGTLFCLSSWDLPSWLFRLTPPEEDHHGVYFPTGLYLETHSYFTRKSEALQLTDSKAWEFMLWLYEQTPGGHNVHPDTMPYEGQAVSVTLTGSTLMIEAATLVPRLIGKGGQNVRHLREMFARIGVRNIRIS